MNENLIQRRKSYMETGEIYFWTATIFYWKKLLKEDRYKDVIIDTFTYLTEKGLADIYAFVIMPNHIHLIWKTNEMNGNETVQASLLKYTAHTFLNMLRRESSPDPFNVKAPNKAHEFWRRDSLAVHLYTRRVALQKLNYIHKNPLAEHWQLAKDPCEYKYSSAKYYETGEKDFSFLKDLWEVL